MNFPSLDCHAHISVDVTERQLSALGSVIVFAMTRDPAEAFEATKRLDANLLWGCGAHPSYIAGGGTVDIEQFARRSQQFALVGEIGLDRRSGNMSRQREVLEGLLRRLHDEPVLLSIHSAGASMEVAEALAKYPHAGAIMHWFTGAASELDALMRLGCYFSVNTVMRREVLTALPLDRILPETDFPTSRRRTGTKPGDTSQLEALVSSIHEIEPLEVRRQFYRNLRRLSVASGAIDRMPSLLTDLVLLA